MRGDCEVSLASHNNKHLQLSIRRPEWMFSQNQNYQTSHDNHWVTVDWDIHDMFDHIIVGAGINGSSAAYQLAKRGRNVLLLEKVVSSCSLQLG